jgi:hypothetical protein
MILFYAIMLVFVILGYLALVIEVISSDMPEMVKGVLFISLTGVTVGIISRLF